MFTSNPAQSGNLSKAKEFMKAGMNNQAIALLEKEIEVNPTNAAAHFELGNCYALNGNLTSAEQRFKSAVQLDSKYGYKVGEIFIKVGRIALDNGLPINTAQASFAKAIEYQPSIRLSLTEKLYQEGENLLKTGLLGMETPKFQLAAFFNPKVREKIHQLYNRIGEKASDEQCHYYYQQSGMYCDNCYNRQAGERLIAIGKKLAVVPGQEPIVKKYRDAAIQVIGQANVDLKFPSVIVYNPGEYIFRIRAGEQTDHQISFPDRPITQLIFYEEGSKFKRVYSNGVTAQLDEPITINGIATFKFVAISDTKIRMVVKESTKIAE